MEYQYNIAGHLCRIVFCDAGNDSSLLPSFSPFESEEEGNLLFCLSVDDAFRWPVTGEEVGQFDCGGNNFGVYRLPDGSYQFEICDEKKALCCYLQANADFSDCTAALVAESDAGRRFGLNNALMLVYAFASAPYATLLMHASVIRNDGRGYLFLGKSGTGKSTHTRLWLSHIPGSDLMNDDNPVVRVVEGTVYVYGSPWGGENTLLPPGVCAGGSFCPVTAMSGKYDSERERIGKFCLALAVRIDHEMGSPYSFGSLRHHFGHHPPFADIPFRMQAG